MNLRTLYVSKLAKCPLICLADLADDLQDLQQRAAKKKSRKKGGEGR
jgi:hypothetical protein